MILNKDWTGCGAAGGSNNWGGKFLSKLARWPSM